MLQAGSEMEVEIRRLRADLIRVAERMGNLEDALSSIRIATRLGLNYSDNLSNMRIQLRNVLDIAEGA